MWAVLPVKDLENVKTRLAPALSPVERVSLFNCMLHDVLTAMSKVSAVRNLLMVTRDAQVGRIGESYGAKILWEPSNHGHSEAVSGAARWLISRGANGFMQVPADIPGVRPDELSGVIAVHRKALQRSFTISPSHDYFGSNCVLCTPPDLLELTFGYDSFRMHMQRARAQGIEPKVVEYPGIALDIDTPQDLARFFKLRHHSTRTQKFLGETKLGPRVVEMVSACKVEVIA